MPIIGQVERKHWKVKFLNVMIHVILILGAATMVYPLLLMLSGSVKSSVDFKNFTIWPGYLSRSKEGRTLLFRKYLSSKYNGSTIRLSNFLKDPVATFDNVEPPENTGKLKRKVEDYRIFLAECKKTLPYYWFLAGMANEAGITPLSTRNYRAFLQEKFGKGDEGLLRLNEKFGSKYQAWDELYLPPEDFFSRRAVSDYSSGLLRTVRDFKYSPYMNDLVEVWPDIEGSLIAMLRRDFSRNLADVNRKLGMSYNSWSDVTVPASVPLDNPRMAEVWEEFVKGEINLDFIRLDVKQAGNAWRNFILNKYGTLENAAKTTRMNWKNVQDIVPDPVIPRSGVIRTDWQDFIKGHSTRENGWVDFLKKKYKNRIADLNKRYGTKYTEFDAVPVPAAKKLPPAGEGKIVDPALLDALELDRQVALNRTREVPASAITLDTLANRYRAWLKKRFNGDVEAMNNAYENGYFFFTEVRLPAAPCGEKNLAASADWTEFAATLKPEELSLARQATIDYKKYLKDLYTRNGICDYKKMAADYKLKIRSGEDNDIPAFLRYPAARRYTDKARADYLGAIRGGRFATMLVLDKPARFQARFQKFLENKYQTVDKLNRAWRTAPDSFREVSLPTREREWSLLEENASVLCREFLKRNYLMVFDTLFTNGNAAFNTVLYCFLAVLAALLVNPLCAYGLSRYKPASSYKILLFLMLPMAFPGMVLGIPQFLLVKNFGLLNTFAALILPGMANGYSIFLLKGFFDSLPKELFESAAIDGASEWTVFWHIAMGLSTPILSVIALGAFTGAYGNFMMAFLLCQKKSMWTMMVYLYQLQQRASPAVGFAALAIAAIPTLIVFIFCQNIIIKGIVVPTEK